MYVDVPIRSSFTFNSPNKRLYIMGCHALCQCRCSTFSHVLLFSTFFYFILLSEHIEQKINVKPFLMLAFVLACLLAFILIVLFVLVKLRNRYKTKSKNDQICRVFGCWCAFGNKFRYIHFCFHSFPYGLDFQQTKVESHVLCLTRVRWPPILTYHRQ